ncbi:hypothetical protein [Nonomuraea sp. NPDC003201]
MVWAIYRRSPSRRPLRTTPPTEIPDGDVQRPFAIATDPDRTLVATVSETDIGIGLPEADGVGSQPLPGLVTYAAKQPSVAFAHQRTGQIARALTIIKDASAPTEYRFPISAPEGSMLEVEEDDGTVLIYNNDFYLAEIDLPWARDANGNPVPTSYRVEGMTLIQTVNHAGADPALKLQCEWWGQEEPVLHDPVPGSRHRLVRGPQEELPEQVAPAPSRRPARTGGDVALRA